MLIRLPTKDTLHLVSIIVLLCFSFSGKAFSSIDLLTGSYYDSVVDLNVKVRGGSATVRRTYENGQWLINSRWSPLVFKYGASGALTSILRNDLEFKVLANGTSFSDGDNLRIEKVTSGFRWLNTYGDWMLFDQLGSLKSYGDKSNVKMSLNYDANKKVVGLADSNQKVVLSFTYNNGDLTSVQDYSGRKVNYQYNAAHYLTKVIDVRGNTWVYSYDNANRVASVTDPKGNVITIIYDIRGRIQSDKNQDGIGNTYSYNYTSIRDEYYTGITSTSGKIEEYFYGGDRVLRKYLVNGQVKQELKTGTLRTWQLVDSRGNTTVQKYDEWGNLSERIFADGSKETFTFASNSPQLLLATNENGMTTSYQYDTYGNVVKMIEAVSTPTEQVNTYSYDTHGQMISRTEGGVTITFEYDGYGNRIKKIDAQGNISVYTYDALGNALTLTDALGNVQSNNFDAVGNLLSVSDALGNKTTSTYDELNNILSDVDERGNTTRYAYDTRSNRTSNTNAQGATVSMAYDVDNNMTKQTDASGKATTLAYDAGGMLRSITGGGGDTIAIGSTGSASGQPTSISFPTFTRNLAYDKRDRVIKTIDILDPYTSVTTQMVYDAVGNMTSEIDNAGRTTRYEYDALNRRIKTIKTNGDITQFVYDAQNNLISVTNGKGVIAFKYEYDLNGRKIKEIRPMGQVSSYGYDAAGRMTAKTDPNGKVTSIVYDAVGRITSVSYPAVNALPAKTVSYTYDKSGNMLTYNDGVTNGVYTYDSENRQLSATVNYGAFSVTSSQTYYANGKKKSYTGVDGVTLSYSYDVSNKLQAISIPTQGSIIYNSYHGSLPTKITLPGGSTRNYSYDGLQRITAIQANDPAGNSLMNYGYTYDAASNITQKSTEHGVYNYAYDAVDRLTSVQPPTASGLSNESFAYDQAGNRTSYNGNAAWSYNAKDELVARPGVSYVYDLNGNMIKKTEGIVVTDYVYNGENRLAQVKQGANIIASYTYDPFGKRISKTTNGVTTYYAYSNEGLSAELNDAGAVQVTYGYTPGSQWGVKPLFTQSGGNYYYYINDHIETPQKLIAKNGAVAWETKYEAFGQTAANSTSNLRFPGQYADAESGLNYNFNRMYNPKTGRYNSLDPLGLNGGMNPYMYAGANPVSFTDPSGLLCFFGQSSGNISCFEKTGKRYMSACGYSGFRDYAGIPMHEDKKDLGVIPKGMYSLSEPMTMTTVKKVKLPGSRKLFPFEFTEARLKQLNRSGFWIHKPLGNENPETKLPWMKVSSRGCGIFSQVDIDKIHNKGEYLVVY